MGVVGLSHCEFVLPFCVRVPLTMSNSIICYALIHLCAILAKMSIGVVTSTRLSMCGPMARKKKKGARDTLALLAKGYALCTPMGAATGGSAVMNVNSGGPHILLFERDQQLTTLLMSEFQLAGYECHPARTAVEVFDAIARYSIRLVLVNLAQAAAGRREFWVALDAQRRGRGVQVLTFRCLNIAGYGSDYSEETSRTVLTDMEVEGMMGIMNLVDAIRSRIPGSTTGSYSRLADIPVTTMQEAGNPNSLNRRAEVVEPTVTPRATSQTTASFSMQSTNPSLAVPSATNATPSEPVHPARMNRPVNPASG